MNPNLWKRKEIFIPVWLTVSTIFFLSSTNFNEVDIIAETDYTIEAFTDSIDGGNSWVQYAQQKGVICYNYELKEGTQYPFSGIKIKPKHHLDLSEIDYLEYHIKPDRKKSVHVFIYFMLNDSTELFMRSELNTTPEQTIYKVPISSFDFPSWHLKGKNIYRNELESFTLEKAKSLRVSNDIFISTNQKDEICVEALKMGSNNATPIVISIMIFLFGVVAHVLIEKLKGVKIEIKYVPAEVNTVDFEVIQKEELHEIISFINANYTNSSLTLYMIKKNIKIPENKISLLIKNEFGVSYKTYVNQLRIEEAKRLLTNNAAVRINEVSDAVGFGGTTTFNKVFKEETGSTPTEFCKRI